jgi:CDP-glucose 4,6-dehydratase
MHYLITGHTGFKGSWLALILEMLGHTVSGIALDPPSKSLFKQSNLSSIFTNDIRLDIRDGEVIKKSIKAINPDVIVHLAAQPLVRESYSATVKTFEINVLGTLNVLEAMKELQNLKAALIITTDKVYKNHSHLRGYIESDELGGNDPYSASKAAADIATQSWVKSFGRVPIAIARAGNVIGGGDWASDRIIPDLVDAYSKGRLPTVRYPEAIRPWQHVLDCLHGYLQLIERQLSIGIAGEWNFGPELSEKHTVGDLVSAFASRWGVIGKLWNLDDEPKFHEAGYLLLDSSKARQKLDWHDKLTFNETIQWTVDWYKAIDSSCANSLTREQIAQYFKL